MYAFIDRPVLSLDPGGRFLIWTVRNWVRAMTEGRCPAAAVGPAFAKWNMMGAFAPFHRMLALLNAHGRQTFAIAPVECSQVAEHEALFLTLVSNVDQRRPARLQGTVTLIVAEEHVPALLEAVATLGGAMLEAGIFPREPAAPWEAAKRTGK
ncbi:hypothetical protein BH10PSE13_BH10PSE13_12490 [soil metagenome]